MSRRALLVGINEYKERRDGKVEDRPTWTLSGCINDVEHLRGLLLKHFDFEPGEIRVLSNPKVEGLTYDEATRKNIQENLRDWLLKDCKDDGSEVRLFQISGHGSWVKDQSLDEFDGQDEVVVPHIHDWSDPFLDDQLREIFDTIPDNVNFTFIADTCHSTSIAMSVAVQPIEPVFEERVNEHGHIEIVPVFSGRPPEAPYEPASAHGRFLDAGSLRNTPQLVRQEGGGAPPKGAEKFGLHKARHALLSAARDLEFASESSGVSDDGKTRGVFSWALGRAIEKSIAERRRPPTYLELIERVGGVLTHHPQKPSLSCPKKWHAKEFLAPLGGGQHMSHVDPAAVDKQEEKEMSALSDFLLEMGKKKKLMKKGGMKKAMEAARLTDDQIATLKSGDADRIKGWVAAAAAGNDRPIGEEGTGG